MPRRLLPIARKLVQQRLWTEALEYILENKENIRQASEYPALLLALGQGLLEQRAALQHTGYLREAAARTRDAASALEELVELAPQSAPARFALGEAREAQGDPKEALRHYQEATRLSPKDPHARNAIAWLLAMAGDPALRNPAEALRWAKEAVALTGGKDPAHLDTLAVAHAELGEFELAVEVEQRALDLAAKVDPNLVSSLRSNLQRFQNKQPLSRVAGQ
jgi:tetratricopeptide (TPR) repeat protein